MNKAINYILVIACLLFSAGPLNADEVLTWDDCILEAKNNNPDLISAVESVNQQKADKAITASALYPQVDATLGASTAKTTTTSSTTGVKTSSTTDSYSYGASATQLIFDGLKTVNNIKAASENIKSAQQNYRFTSSEVRLNLRTAFISLLRAQELIKVAEDIIKIRRDNFELITLRYQSGLEHRGALLTAEANLSEANFELAQAKRDVVLAQRQMTKEMGRREFKPIQTKGDFVVYDTALNKPDFDMLVKDNPSLLQAVAKRNSAAFSLKSAYADFFPQLSGNAGASKSSSHWPPRDDQWSLGLNVTMPIFEGGLRFAQVSQAQALYKQTQADERSIKDAAVVSLEQTWVTLQDALGTVDVQRKSLEAAEERSKIAEAQYSTGFITFDNWIIIENDLVSAKKNYLNAQANALLAEAGWKQAKGETLEYAQK